MLLPLFVEIIIHLRALLNSDMLRVVLSIKAGKFTASTILRKLGTYSQNNKLYQAFSELGRVVRTVFLLEYLGSEESMAQAVSASLKIDG